MGNGLESYLNPSVLIKQIELIIKTLVCIYNKKVNL